LPIKFDWQSKIFIILLVYLIANQKFSLFFWYI